MFQAGCVSDSKYPATTIASGAQAKKRRQKGVLREPDRHSIGAATVDEATGKGSQQQHRHLKQGVIPTKIQQDGRDRIANSAVRKRCSDERKRFRGRFRQ
jgi:hypothetical protein